MKLYRGTIAYDGPSRFRIATEPKERQPKVLTPEQRTHKRAMNSRDVAAYRERNPDRFKDYMREYMKEYRKRKKVQA